MYLPRPIDQNQQAKLAKFVDQGNPQSVPKNLVFQPFRFYSFCLSCINIPKAPGQSTQGQNQPIKLRSCVLVKTSPIDRLDAEGLANLVLVDITSEIPIAFQDWRFFALKERYFDGIDLRRIC